MSSCRPSSVPTPVAVRKSDRSEGIAAQQPTLQPIDSHEATTAQDIRVQLQYLKDDPIYQREKPLQITPNFMDREGRTNVRLAPGEVETINDVRGREHDFTLDRNGFKYVKSKTDFSEWDSQPKIAQKYLPELETLLKQEVDGCDEIMFYDARLRFANDGGHRVQGLSYNPFARQVHTDNTEKSVLAKIRSLTDMKADYVLSGRCRIINIWRPIKHPVYDCGLTIADGGKLKDGDIIECDRHRQDTGKYWDTMGVAQYRPGFDWYYMSQQDESDVLLFKNHDSANDVPARTCLHTAFDIPPELIPANTPTRESIEVRALIFTYPQHQPKPVGGLNMPHPLAASLEGSHLTHTDFDESLTDRLRTDIDEGSEVKDAVLLLRKREIRRLERVQTQLQAQRDELASKLQAANAQAELQSGHVHALQQQNFALQHSLETQYAQLQDEISALSVQLVGGRMEQTSARQAQSDERVILAQQLARALGDVEKWKGEAMKCGNEAVSRCWQASVDEAIRREREKDAVVIEGLRAEIRALRMEKA